MVKLEEYIGEIIFMQPIVPLWPTANKADPLYLVKLHGVEMGGIWIESEGLTALLKSFLETGTFGPFDTSKMTKTPVFFYPYAQIACLIVGQTDLDLGSLGLREGS